MKLRTEIKTSVSDFKSLEMINDYWKMNEGWVLEFSEEYLAQKYNMNKRSLNSFCQNYSSINIFLSACKICGEDLVTEFQNRNELYSRLNFLKDQHLNEEDIICSECLVKQEKRFKDQYITQKLSAKEQTNKIQHLQKALKEEKWERLQEDEWEIIRRFVLSHNADKIYNDAFQYYVAEMRKQEIANGGLNEQPTSIKLLYLEDISKFES